MNEKEPDQNDILGLRQFRFPVVLSLLLCLSGSVHTNSHIESNHLEPQPARDELADFRAIPQSNYESQMGRRKNVFIKELNQYIDTLVQNNITIENGDRIKLPAEIEDLIHKHSLLGKVQINVSIPEDLVELDLDETYVLDERISSGERYILLRYFQLVTDKLALIVGSNVSKTYFTVPTRTQGFLGEITISNNPIIHNESMRTVFPDGELRQKLRELEANVISLGDNIASATGYMLDKDGGLIVTAAHVVCDNTKSTKYEFHAHMIGCSSRNAKRGESNRAMTYVDLTNHYTVFTTKTDWALVVQNNEQKHTEAIQIIQSWIRELTHNSQNENISDGDILIGLTSRSSKADNVQPDKTLPHIGYFKSTDISSHILAGQTVTSYSGSIPNDDRLTRLHDIVSLDGANSATFIPGASGSALFKLLKDQNKISSIPSVYVLETDGRRVRWIAQPSIDDLRDIIAQLQVSLKKLTRNRAAQSLLNLRQELESQRFEMSLEPMPKQEYYLVRNKMRRLFGPVTDVIERNSNPDNALNTSYKDQVAQFDQKLSEFIEYFRFSNGETLTKEQISEEMRNLLAQKIFDLVDSIHFKDSKTQEQVIYELKGAFNDLNSSQILSRYNVQLAKIIKETVTKALSKNRPPRSLEFEIHG